LKRLELLHKKAVGEENTDRRLPEIEWKVIVSPEMKEKLDKSREQYESIMEKYWAPRRTQNKKDIFQVGISK